MTSNPAAMTTAGPVSPDVAAGAILGHAETIPGPEPACAAAILAIYDLLDAAAGPVDPDQVRLVLSFYLPPPRPVIHAYTSISGAPAAGCDWGIDVAVTYATTPGVAITWDPDGPPSPYGQGDCNLRVAHNDQVTWFNVPRPQQAGPDGQ
jgi:hypothetical protein